SSKQSAASGTGTFGSRVGRQGDMGDHGHEGRGRVTPQIATSTQVDRAGMLEFARHRHHAILITSRSDGSPQASPVTCGIDGSGRGSIAAYPERAKTANARRSGTASVLLLSEDFDGPWIQIDGDAEVLDLPGALEPLVEYYRSISGEHPDWDEYRAA